MKRGLGDEQVLHHQMLEFCQRLARVLQIGVRHRGILALDIHAGDLAGMDRVDDLDHGEAANRIELLMPELLERLAQIGAPDRLIIRQEHRDQPGVGSALHVVLAAQRMQPGAGPADLPGDQRQRDQAARIVGAVHMLADAHAPEDDRGAASAHTSAPLRAMVSAAMPQIGSIFSGVNSLMRAFRSSKPSV